MDYSNTLRSRLSMTVAAAAIAIANVTPALADHRMTLPIGTVIPVKLDQALSSKNNEPGDRFTATVKEGRDDAGLPYGTRIEGVVREAMSSSDGKPGVLDVEFRRMVIPGGETKTIEGTLYTLNGKDVKRRDGRLVATADKSKDRLKWIGIGAGAGALIGTLMKGNVLVDALLGAGAGYLYSELQGKKPGDVSLKEGTEFGVRLDRAVDFTMDDRAYYRYRERLSDDANFDDPAFRSDRDRDRERYRDDPYYYDRYRDQNGRERRWEDDRYYRNGTANGTLTGDIGMVIDRREVKFNGSKPYMRNDVIFVPLDAVSKTADIRYRYDSSDKLIRSSDNRIRLHVGSRVAFVNGERRLLPAPAESKNGTVYVPMQFVAWLTGGSASYDRESKTVIVTSDRDFRD